MLTNYVVNKDWDSQQLGDIVSYYGSAENYSFGSTGYASIYATIEDANGLKISGAVGVATDYTDPVPYTTARQYVYVVNGRFNETVLAAGDAKYTLDFSSIYTDNDHLTSFVGSFTTTAQNDVGIRVSSGTVLFGETAVVVGDEITNRTTISLNRAWYDENDTDHPNVGRWQDSEFVVGGDTETGETPTAIATAKVTNTDLTVSHWVWVGSAYNNFEAADDAVRYTLDLNNSKVTATTFQVRNTGKVTAVASEINAADMILRGNVDLDSTAVSLSVFSNVYGETGRTATLTLTNGSSLTSTSSFQVGKTLERTGAIVLEASSIGYTEKVGQETVIHRSGDINVLQGASITMDKDSQIYAGDIVNNGTINIGIDTSDKEDWIDAATFTNTDGSIVITGELKNFSVKRVINSINAGEEEGSVDKADVNVARIEVKPVGTETVTTATAATRKGKVAVAAGVDYSTLYLSNRIDEDEDFATAIKNRAETVSYYVDFNAFQLPKSALKEGVTADTTTILIDGGDRTALTYESIAVEYVDPDTNVRKNVIDGLTFAKDGTNAVADDPDQDGDQSLPEKNVEFVLSGMDAENPMSYRLLTEGITVEKGVTFTADKMYQKSGTTTINGVLDMAANDTFQIAGGEVKVTRTGSLTGDGIISIIATNRDPQGQPIKAELNVLGAPITLSQLEIGANSTVTLTDTNAANFGTVIMRKTNVSDFVGPVLTIIDSTVTANSFDTTKGRVNINFQSQLFVVPAGEATPTIEGGELNLTVSADDVALLQNYGGAVDPDLPQPELFYTIVHAKLNEKSTLYPNGVVLSCDGDSEGDGKIDGTEYVYTSLGGQGLYVMHKDVAQTLYVNAAWTNKQTGEVVGEGMFYKINAFNTFTEALVAASTNEFDTTIKVLSVVNETYSTDLGDGLVFANDITVEAAVQETSLGPAVAPGADFQGWTVTLENQGVPTPDFNGRYDLCVSPAGDDPATADVTEPGKTFWIKKGVDITVTNDPETENSVKGGIWVNYLHENGSLVKIEDNVNAGLIAFAGKAIVTNTATLTSIGGNIQLYSAADVSITGTYDATATEPQAAQATAQGIGFVSGSMTVDSSKFQANTFYVTDDWARPTAFSSTVSVDVEDSLWTGVEYVTRFYREDTKIDAEFTFDNSTFDLSDRFRNIVYLTTGGQDDSNAPIAGAEAATFNFINGSTLKVGGVLSNAGEINVVSSTIDAAEFTNNGIVSLTGTVDAPAYVLKDFENGAASADANLDKGTIYLDGKVVFGNTVINMVDDDDNPDMPAVEQSEFVVATLTNNGSVIVKAGVAAVEDNLDTTDVDETAAAIPAAAAFLTGKIANNGNIRVDGTLTLDKSILDEDNLYNITNDGTFEIYGTVQGGKIRTYNGGNSLKYISVYGNATLNSLVIGDTVTKNGIRFYGLNSVTEAANFDLANAKSTSVSVSAKGKVNLTQGENAATNVALTLGGSGAGNWGTAYINSDVSINSVSINTNSLLSVSAGKKLTTDSGVDNFAKVSLNDGSTLASKVTNQDGSTLTIEATTGENVTKVTKAVTNKAGATINIDGNAKFSAAVSNSGTINVNETAEFTAGIDNANGTVAMNVDSDQISGSRQASGNVYATIVGGDVKLGNGVNFDWGFADNSAAIEGTTVTTLYGGNVIVGGGETAVTAYVFDKGFETTEQEQPVVLYNDSNSLDIRAKGTVKLSSPGAIREPSNLTVKTLKIATGGVLDFGSVKLVDNAHLTPVLTVLGGESADIADETITIKVPGDWYKTADTPMLLIDGSAITLTGDDGNGTYEAFYDRIVKGEATYFSVIDDDLYLDPAKCIKVSKSHEEVPAQGWYQKVSTAVADHPEGPLYVLDSADGAFGNVFFEDAEAYIVGDGDGTEQSPALVFGAPVYGGKRVSKVTDNEAANEEVYLPETLNLKVKTGDTFVVVDADTTATFKSYLVGGDYLDKFATIEDETEEVVNYYRFGDTNLTIKGGNFNYNTQGSSRAIIGGINNELAGRATATLTGDVNLTIAGGTFLGYNVYGGNYSAVSKSLGKNTRIDGNVFLTIDTRAGDIAFTQTGDKTTGGSIVAGSLGHSTITGDTVVTLTGTGSLTGKTLWGGSDGDYLKSNGMIESFVEGDRVLSFQGFSGDLEFTAIEGFSKVEFFGENDVDFAWSDSFNQNVTKWEVVSGATVENFDFDFTKSAFAENGTKIADTLTLIGLDEESADWSFLGEGSTVTGFADLMVSFNGGEAVAYSAAAFDNAGGWVDSAAGFGLKASDWSIAIAN